MSAFQLSPLASITTGFLVLFVGKRLNREWNFLQRYSIPEPVSGGLLVALLLTVLHVLGGPELLFSLESRDFLLVYFFTTVGMNARFADLRRGGPALFILLGLTIGYMTLQNIIGELASEHGFAYSINVMPITVAALMTPRWIRRHLEIPASNRVFF